ncbi:MAG: di-trans,poly-cis-decaprenylcistransferase, partial [Methanoculleus sp.]
MALVIYRLYEKYLLRNLRTFPEQICFMITEQDMLDAPGNLYLAVQWCRDLGIGSVMFHISTDDPVRLERCLSQIRRISSIARLTLHYRDGQEISGEGMDVTVAIGKSGREEIADCVRRMAEDGVDPASVDEGLLESYLTFKYEPDLVIKTGAD